MKTISSGFQTFILTRNLRPRFVYFSKAGPLCGGPIDIFDPCFDSTYWDETEISTVIRIVSVIAQNETVIRRYRLFPVILAGAIMRRLSQKYFITGLTVDFIEDLALQSFSARFNFYIIRNFVRQLLFFEFFTIHINSVILHFNSITCDSYNPLDEVYLSIGGIQ